MSQKRSFLGAGCRDRSTQTRNCHRKEEISKDELHDGLSEIFSTLHTASIIYFIVQYKEIIRNTYKKNRQSSYCHVNIFIITRRSVCRRSTCHVMTTTSASDRTKFLLIFNKREVVFFITPTTHVAKANVNLDLRCQPLKSYMHLLALKGEHLCLSMTKLQSH